MLAVDAGGTSTRSACFRLDGECLGIGAAGAANPVAHDVAEAVEEIMAALGAALGDVPGPAVAAVALGLAGGSTRPGLGPLLAGRLGSLGVAVPPVILPDGLAAFRSGTVAGTGCVLVAGTGAVALRIEEGRVVRAVDGMGWLLGDAGSGFWMGRETVRAALADLDGRGRATGLTPLVLAALGLDPADRRPDADGRPAAIATAERLLYGTRPVRLARFAGLVFEAPGDPVADEILAAAAEALATTLAGAWSPDAPGPLVVAGGLLARFAPLRERLAAGLRRRGLPAELTVVEDGVVGLAVGALRDLGVVVGEDLFGRLSNGLARRRRGAYTT